MNFKGAMNFALAAAAVAVLAATPAVADQTGFDGIHAKMRVGNKVCFDGHSHSGYGAGPNKKAAEYAAIQSWADFTAAEYGSDWAHYGKSYKASMRCSQSAAGWSCDLDATPCR